MKFGIWGKEFLAGRVRLEFPDDEKLLRIAVFIKKNKRGWRRREGDVKPHISIVEFIPHLLKFGRFGVGKAQLGNHFC